MSDDKRFEHLMIDIETMATHPSNALILSIGLLEFDPTPEDGLRVGQGITLWPSLAEQLLDGRLVSPDTQKFWSRQSIAAIEDWRDGEQETLHTVANAVDAMCSRRAYVWAKGDLFDLGNVASLAMGDGRTTPWHYRAPKCMRAFLLHRARTRDIPAGALDDAVAHTALSDCLVQAWDVWAHWPKLESPAHIPHHSV